MATESATVSVSTLKLHHGYYRWAIERESASRSVRLWSRLGSSKLIETDKITLRNVLWAIAAMERSYRTLEINVDRRLWHVMKACHLSWLSCPGHTVVSRWTSLGQSLWLDLADVLVWYRAVVDRLGHVRCGSQRADTPFAARTRAELSTANTRVISEFGGKRVRKLAD